MKSFSNFDLKSYNSYRLNSKAKQVFFPENVNNFLQINSGVYGENIAYIGGGNNIIFSKEYYNDTIFTVIQKNFSKTIVIENKIIALAGAELKDLSMLAYVHSLSGLETFYDIPGTLGGAIYMNAGAYGEDIFNYLESVVVLSRRTSKIITYFIKDLTKSYRSSPFQSNDYIILKAVIRLKKNPKLSIINKMRTILQKRIMNFPRYNPPNAGSVFVRPSLGLTVGEMVQSLNLKGLQIGGAMISTKHGGFIVNVSNANAADILSLIKLIKDKVKKHYNVELVLEQKII